MTLADVRERLKHFDPSVRSRALDELIAAWQAGRVSCDPRRDVANLHCHTFFSYNGYGHSPTSLVWLAKEMGWHAIATVDFDVLDGVEECLEASDRVGVRGATGLETRVYLPEFAGREINSPGEPGVCYHIGIGFASGRAAPSAAPILREMQRRAAQRNRDMVARLNAYLDPVAIEYDRDVLPLTPAGNATERHILVAYDLAARALFSQRRALIDYWAGKLGVTPAVVDGFIGDVPFPHDMIRAKLMKRGGVGYVQPGPQTFPPFDEVNRAIIACGAIPLYAWLDGTTEGEAHIGELLALLVNKGVAGINIVPDRNWNVPDPEVQAVKVRELHSVVELARSLDLPVIAGTEMNKPGQRLIDDFDAEPLRPLRDDFMRGADFVYGHTIMQRALGLGYQSQWARTHLPSRRERNAFYIAVGGAVEPGPETLARVAQLDASKGPDAIVAGLASLQSKR